MDLEKKKRTAVRRNFTRLKTVFEEELLSVPFDYQSAKVKFQRIEQVNEELKKLNERIRDLMIEEDVEGEDLDEEMMGAEQYEMQFLEMQNRCLAYQVIILWSRVSDMSSYRRSS